MTVPFQYTIRGRNLIDALEQNRDAAAVLWDARDAELEDWIKSIWQGGDAIADGAIGRVKLAADAIQSTNYAYTSGDFSDAGSFLDLAAGDLRTPGLWIDGESGDVKVRGDVGASAFTLLDAAGSDTLAVWAPDATSDTYIDFDSAISFPTAGTASATKLEGLDSRGVLGVKEALGLTSIELQSVSAAENSAGDDYEQNVAKVNVASHIAGEHGLPAATAELVASTVEFGPAGDGATRQARISAYADRPASGPETSIELSAGTIDLSAGTIDLQGLLRRDGDDLSDDGGRYYLRTDAGRSRPHMVQHGVETATSNASGDISVTFGEAYDAAPTVQITRETTATTTRTAHVTAVSTTGFTVRFFDNTGAAQASVSNIKFHWTAVGYKEP